jgi:hypothetical protein
MFDLQGGYNIGEFWAHESEDLRLDLDPPEVNQLTQLHAFGRINADSLEGDRLSIKANSISLLSDNRGNKPSLSVSGSGTISLVQALEATIFGGINIPAADVERPDEFPYSADEKSIQYALTVSHQTLGRTVEIDKEGTIRANAFTDMEGNPIGGDSFFQDIGSNTIEYFGDELRVTSLKDPFFIGAKIGADSEFTGTVTANKFVGDGSGLTGTVSTKVLVDAFQNIQMAVSNETTVAGIKKALTNSLGGLIEKLEG